jgi:hypothetical protein
MCLYILEVTFILSLPLHSLPCYVPLRLTQCTVQCRSPLDPGASRCFIISGQFTILGQGKLSQASPKMYNATRAIMNSGKLNNVHPEVVSVRYIGFPNATNPWLGDAPKHGSGPSPNNNLSGKNQFSNNSGLRAWHWLLLASCLFIVITAMLFLRRRKRNRSMDRSMGSTGTENLDSPLAHWRDEVVRIDEVEVESETTGGKTYLDDVKALYSHDDDKYNDTFSVESTDSSGRHPFGWRTEDNSRSSSGGGLGQHDYV